MVAAVVAAVVVVVVVGVAVVVVAAVVLAVVVLVAFASGSVEHLQTAYKRQRRHPEATDTNATISAGNDMLIS